MDATTLIGPSTPLGYPAPYWLLVFFKVLGFTLHIGLMHLWYAGIIIAMLMWWRGGEHARHLAARLMKQMPIIVAFGINFGIVPLLFVQVAYYRVFYPATILMAWPWFSVIVLLIFAYYGVYIYATGLRDNEARMTRFRRTAGWVAAFLFMGMGFLFANAFSLMTHVDAWSTLWQNTSVAGAPLGIALNAADPTFWPRWLMMFGLAITTTAAYMTVDGGLFASQESESYRHGVAALALKVYTLGIIWFAIAGSWYAFGSWRPELRQIMFSGRLIVLTVLTAIAPGLPWLLIFAQRKGVTRALAISVGLAQFGVLGLNAISRQVVQNAELRSFLNVTAEPVHTQWSPLILFLTLFVAGLALIVWLIRVVIAAERQSMAQGRSDA